MRKLTYDYFINLLDELKKNYELQGNVTNDFKFKQSFIARVYISLPGFLRFLFRPILHPLYNFYKFHKADKTTVIPNFDNKKFSWSFLFYIIKHPNVSFDLNLFPKSDYDEIIKFINNKIYFSLMSYIPKKILFDKVDYEFQKKYNLFLKKNIRYFLFSKGVKIKYNDKRFLLPINSIEISVFYHSLGLKNVYKEVLNKLKNRDALDCGAYIGDSALVLSNYFKRVYGFEPEKHNFNLFKRTLQLNQSKNIIPVNKGVGDKEENLRISFGAGSSFISNKGSEKISITTIDNFVKKNKLNVGLIKMDLEGFEYNAIMGAKETIKKFKPILLICLYHTGKDFFEIPPFIKKLVPEYYFRFLNLNHNGAFEERILLAYV